MGGTNNNICSSGKEETIKIWGRTGVFWILVLGKRERRKVISRWGGNRFEGSLFGGSLSKSPGLNVSLQFWGACQSSISSLSLLSQKVTCRSKNSHSLERELYPQSIWLKTTKCQTWVSRDSHFVHGRGIFF